MQKRSLPACALAAAFALVHVSACDPATDPPVEDDVIDVRVKVPAPDPNIIDYIGPELTIQPGEDVMWCYWMEPLAEDLVVSHLEALQGQFGHHAVVLSSSVERPAGTLEDCSGEDAMTNIKIDILPSLEILEHQGIRLKAGTQLVFQSHYANVADRPLLVQDINRLTLRPEAEVEEWVSTFTTVELDIEIPAGEQASVQFDCEIPYDTKLQIVGGHLHEEGSRFQMLVGPDVDSLTSVYNVDPWLSQFRDAPPIENYIDDPVELPAGTIVRTICEWDNSKDEALTFPHEMCSSFGYLAGRAEPFLCGSGQVVDTIGELFDGE